MKRTTEVIITPNVSSSEDEVDLHELDITSTGNNRAVLLLKVEELGFLAYKILQFLREESENEKYEEIIKLVEGRE
jgi:hypothetical protein